MVRFNPLFFLIYSTVVNLPSPPNISYFWNFGSLIGFFLVSQILTSFFLSFHYSTFFQESFNSIIHMVMDVEHSWVMRYLHMNGASFFILLIYLHTCRGLVYKRFNNSVAYNIGVLMLILAMLSAFLGYVLPWGQMSFWGATVITNLISAFPYSYKVVFWLWGSFSVGGPTLNRFFIFHFIFPFIIIVFTIFHIFFIHSVSSSNPLGFFSGSFKIPFWPFFGIKDMYSLLFMSGLFFFFFFFFSDFFSDPDNYMKANPLITPLHIKPEWYFLFAYAILRCIPNKLASVLALICSISFFFFFSFFFYNEVNFSPFRVFFFFLWLFNFVLLTFLGGCEVKYFFNFASQISGFLYFIIPIFFIIM